MKLYLHDIRVDPPGCTLLLKWDRGCQSLKAERGETDDELPRLVFYYVRVLISTAFFLFCYSFVPSLSERIQPNIQNDFMMMMITMLDKMIQWFLVFVKYSKVRDSSGFAVS